ncbi:hypothetical protein BH23BAC4_BH23BAC4_03560 [soil metagenome]
MKTTSGARPVPTRPRSRAAVASVPSDGLRTKDPFLLFLYAAFAVGFGLVAFMIYYLMAWAG